MRRKEKERDPKGKTKKRNVNITQKSRFIGQNVQVSRTGHAELVGMCLFV